jgi:hypothetical protein
MSLMSHNKNVPAVPYPELPGVLDQFVAGVKSELAGNLVGVYLVGSLATGDFDLDSDVDFLVITKDELTDVAVRSLQAMHSRIYGLGCYPAQHLEGSYISRDQLNRLEAVGVQQFWFLNNGNTTLERSVHDNQWHVRWTLRERAVTLCGPEPGSLLAPVPAGALLAEIAETMRMRVDDYVAELDQPINYYNTRFGQSFAVLTYCRMLHTLSTGTIQSKLAGVKWAQQALDPEWAGLIKQAWEERIGVRYCVKIHQRADEKALRATLAFIRYAVRKSERAQEWQA